MTAVVDRDAKPTTLLGFAAAQALERVGAGLCDVAELALEQRADLVRHELARAGAPAPGVGGITPTAGLSTIFDGFDWRLVGSLELVAVGSACVTGVLHGFGTGAPDPTLGGPELDGSFVAPRC